MSIFSYIKHSDNLIEQATLVPSSENSSYPVENVKIIPVSKPFRSAQGGIGSFTLNISFPYAITIDTIGIIGHNLSSTATISIESGTSYNPSGNSESVTWRRKSIYHSYTSASRKYWRISIDDESNLDGFIRIGYIVLGERTVLPVNYDFNAITNRRTKNRMLSTAKSVPIVGSRLSKVDTFSINFTNKENADVSTIDTFLDGLDKEQEPVFIIPDPAKSDAYFGRLNTDYSIEDITNDVRTISNVVFQEDGVGESVVDALPIIEWDDSDLDDIVTFSRGSVAYYKDRDLLLNQAASGTLRQEHWFDFDKVGILLEPAVTPEAGIANPEDFSTGWSASELTVSTNQTDEPLASPTTIADKLVESSATSSHTIDESITIAADAWVSWSCFFKPDERSWVRLLFYESGGAANKVEAWFNLSTGATGTIQNGGTGSDEAAYIEPYGNGWYRCVVRGKVNNSATTIVCAIALATADAESSYNGDGSSGLFAWGAQAEEFSVSTSYMRGSARSIDQAQFSFNFVPQAMTAYFKVTDLGSGIFVGDNIRIFQIAGSTTSTPQFLLFWINSTQIWRLLHHNGSGPVTSSAAQLGNIVGSSIEFRCLLYPDGSVQLGYSADGAAEVLASQSSANELSSAWASTNLRPNQVNDTLAGIMLYDKVKFHYGIQSLDFMRQL